MAAPRASIVLVAYNRADSLPSTLDSLLAQSFEDFELIVSDDCSTDATPDVCAEYARRDSRVRPRRNPRNLRMPGNLNAALAEARGEHVAILHDGDRYRADLLERTLGVLDRHPRVGLVFNAYEILDGKGGSHVDRVEMPESMDGREFLRRIYVPNYWGSPIYGTAVVRRAALEEVGPFDPRYSLHSDIEMWVRLAARFDVGYVPEPLMTIAAREPGHILETHYWWCQTVDVRAKRKALSVAAPGALRRLAFEARVRLHYARCALPSLVHGRWSEAAMGVYLATTGRDELAPPY